MATAANPATPTILVNGDFKDDFLLHIPPAAHTLPGFRAWVLSDEFPEKQPVTFINGEIYLDMSKEEILTHAAVKTPIAVQLGRLMLDDDLGDLFINGVLVTNVAACVSNNPDMLAVFWPSLDSGKVRYLTNKKGLALEVEGAPDWVLEIVSNSSVIKDTRDLRQAYHRAGIRETWIVDARHDEVKFDILHWRKSGYAAAPLKGGWQRSRVFGRFFKLSRVRTRRGDARFVLAMKPVAP